MPGLCPKYCRMPEKSNNQSHPTHSDAPSPAAALSANVRLHLGKQLRALYGDPAEDKLPRDLARLVDRVAQVIRAHTEPVDQEFVNGVMDALPNLRAFALSLTGKVDQAEDLVQDTVLKALTKQDTFESGTNLQAWLFTILRNGFYSTHRKTSREVEDGDGTHAASMIAIPDQEDKLALQDLSTALEKLPQEQREAIILIGAEGMSYEDAAEALGVKVGTIKSRVNRARNRLAELMGTPRTADHEHSAAV
ncbi:MAG: polymerase subunit sigma-70 [Microvirga sp.]|jgi:RNA polymerase sigma-70 factor (ECF subfamily)|nr:polymerase subunit sigma-70 [Microvirga sp.]MCD6071005.1 polymerase subunit sigma-70 [Microvirga sp.]MDF2688583.1 polymerase subunit sigma-70 [Microvirga sp.]MDF2971936.1 polymerase subunit sigma-70 [Microvirga sp.]